MVKSNLSRLALGSLAIGLPGGIVAAAPAASAQEAVGDQATGATAEEPVRAAAGQICVFENDNFTGRSYCFTPPNSDSNYTNGSPDWKGTNYTINDQISSVDNQSNHWVKFWQNSGPSGSDSYCSGPGSESSNLSSWYDPDNGYNPEDSFSAHTSSSGRPGSCTYFDTN